LSVSIEHEVNGCVRKVSLLVSVKKQKDQVHVSTVQYRWLNCKKVEFWDITLFSVRSCRSKINLQDLGVTTRGVFQERNPYELRTSRKIAVSIPDGVIGILH